MAFRALEVTVFSFIGVPLMMLTSLADCIYFWINNYRIGSELKKIVIERDPSTISMSWVKKINHLAQKYHVGKIKAVYTFDYVKRFREDLDINSQL
jgi:hypothetical protein